MSVDKDWNRKVSQPTEADFARGVAESATYHEHGANFIRALAAGLLIGRVIRRYK